jgi:dTDP-4-dehydrorhamnose reductase
MSADEGRGVRSKVWLAGSRGMLGSVLAEALESAGVTLVSTDTDLDIADADAVLAFARRERPSLVINAAAYTRVDDAESHEADAFRVNAEGAEVVARAALELAAPVVYFSTDYVFGGSAAQPWREDAPTSAQGVYAQSKLAGERRVLATQGQGGKPYVVRTSWLFGENGANFVRTMLGLMRDKEELRVVADQRGRPTYTRDLAQATLELVGLGSREAAAPGVYHFANSGDVSWHEFATGIREAALEHGLSLRCARVLPVTTAEFPRPAPRPAYSVLDTSRIEAVLGRKPRTWTEALAAYINRDFLGKT